jgi:hypothetical protein
MRSTFLFKMLRPPMLLGTLFLGTLFAISCGSAGPPPPHGFRMRSGMVPSPFSTPCTGPSVARVLTSGVVHFVVGPGSGTEEVFSDHLTNQFGVDDHINGRENANWNFAFDFAESALPNCFPPPGLSMKDFFIQSTGTSGIVNIICGDCICVDCVILSHELPGGSSCRSI